MLLHRITSPIQRRRGTSCSRIRSQRFIIFSPAQMFQNAAGFSVHGSHFTHVMGNMNIHSLAPPSMGKHLSYTVERISLIIDSPSTRVNRSEDSLDPLSTSLIIPSVIVRWKYFVAFTGRTGCCRNRRRELLSPVAVSRSRISSIRAWTSGYSSTRVPAGRRGNRRCRQRHNGRNI